MVCRLGQRPRWRTGAVRSDGRHVFISSGWRARHSDTKALLFKRGQVTQLHFIKYSALRSGRNCRCISQVYLWDERRRISYRGTNIKPMFQFIFINYDKRSLSHHISAPWIVLWVKNSHWKCQELAWPRYMLQFYIVQGLAASIQGLSFKDRRASSTPQKRACKI